MRSPMMVRALLVLILWPAIPAFPEDFHWVRQMGGSTGDRALGVVLDKDDNVCRRILRKHDRLPSRSRHAQFHEPERRPGRRVRGLAR
jgi:hypothetical protein